LSVTCDNVLNAEDFRLLKISVHGETMISLIDAHVSRNTSKPIDRERSVAIVGLDYAAHIVQSGLVLVVWAHEMQAGRASVRTITTGVVNSASERNLPARSEVVNKGGRRNQLSLQEGERAALLTSELRFALQLLESQCDSVDLAVRCHR